MIHHSEFPKIGDKGLAKLGTNRQISIRSDGNSIPRKQDHLKDATEAISHLSGEACDG